MTSEIRVNSLTNRSGLSTVSITDTGVVVAGILTANTGSFSGNVSVGGVLTYEDVTNIDSVGVITARSDVSIADKIIHTGDTNTAIRFPAADTVTIETGGTEALRIDANGRIGIGTDNPGSKLDVVGDISGDTQLARVYNQNADGGTNVKIQRTGNIRAASFVLATGNTNNWFAGILRRGGGSTSNYSISSTEDMSSTAPAFSIDSTSTVYINSYSKVSHPNMDDLQIGNSTGNRGITISSGDAAYGTVAFGDSADGSGTDRYEGFVEYYHNDNSMRLGTSHGERLHITSGGHISQGGGAEPSSTNGGVGLKYGIKSAANNIIIGETTSSSHNGLIFESRVTGRSGGARASQIRMGIGEITFSTAASGADVTEKLRITPAGDVGIGDNAPNNNYGTNLSVHSTATDGARLKISDGTTGKNNTEGLDIISTGGEAYIMNRYAGAMHLATSNINRLDIDSGGRVTTPYQVSFFQRNMTGSSFNSGTMTGGSGDHNVGNHFNASTGVFTAPVAGIYMFGCGVLVNSGSGRLEGSIMKNVTFDLVAFNGTGTTYDGATATVICSLAANDNIRIKRGSGTAYTSNHPNHYFWGRLVG